MDRILARRAVLHLLLATLLAALVLSACSRGSGIEFIEDGNAYTEDGLQDLLAEADLTDLESIATADALDVREEVLIGLRRKGSAASAVADMLMRGFPDQTFAVPARVEAAEFNGADVWVVVEAWGDEDGILSHRRIWVFDQESGSLRWSASQR